MVNAQEWLDQNYPKEIRNTITGLDISNKNLERELDLRDFVNLKELLCVNNELTSLDISSCENLQSLHCSNNQLIALRLGNLPQLNKLVCFNNFLTDLDLGGLNPEKLYIINLENNNLSEQDLNYFGFFVNLTTLWIGSSSERSRQGIYNRFRGSLEPLKNMSRLGWLNISNTDIDSGLEHLPDSVQNFTIDQRQPKISALLTNEQGMVEKNEYGFVKNFQQKLQDYKQKFAKRNMSSAQTWLKENFPEEERNKITELDLSNKDLEGNLDLTDFTEVIKVDVSGNPRLGQISLMRRERKTIKLRQEQGQHISIDYIDKNGQHWKLSLKEDYAKSKSKYLENEDYISRIVKPELSIKVINQIKDFKHSYTSYNERNENERHNKLTPEQESLINQLISNQELRERYKRFGLCQECQQPNTGKDEFGRRWCQPCNAKHFAKDFGKWTSGNPEIDKFIQEQQLRATDNYKVLEWIPYEQFTNIEQIGEGGFAKVYKAKWTDGPIFDWDTIGNRWGKKCPGNEVVLRFLNNSQDIKASFLQEVSCHKLVNDDSIVPLYGISQDPVTKNYIMVTDWIPQGDMKLYLKKGWERGLRAKLYHLYSINKGLNSIHQQGLVHKDFHSGNLLVSNNYSPSKFFIADFGLSKPANEENKEGKVFGVLPYVAPEVLQGKPYTQTSDIYSFGIIAYELLANSYPYPDLKDLYPHLENDKDREEKFAVNVCSGLRPNIENLPVPQLLKDLIKRCWDADPIKRPTTNEIWNILYEWVSGIDNKENTEFARQYKEIESEYNQFSQNAPYRIHSSAVTHSKAINTKDITQLLQQKIDEEYHTKSLEELTLDNLTIQEDPQEESSFQAHQEIPPKQTNH